MFLQVGHGNVQLRSHVSTVVDVQLHASTSVTSFIITSSVHVPMATQARNVNTVRLHYIQKIKFLTYFIVSVCVSKQYHQLLAFCLGLKHMMRDIYIFNSFEDVQTIFIIIIIRLSKTRILFMSYTFALYREKWVLFKT